jgi:uncharacterized protein YdgA (DUF945 family)
MDVSQFFQINQGIPMKTPIGRSVLSLSLLLSWPALAQDAVTTGQQSAESAAPQQPQAAPPSPMNAPSLTAQPTPEQLRKQMLESPAFKAYLGVLRDLGPFLGRPSQIKGAVSNIEQFSFSPDTRKALMAVFGNDDPLHFTKTPQPGGGTLVEVRLDGLDYKSSSGDGDIGNGNGNGPGTTTMHSEPLAATFSFNRDFKTVHSDGYSPGLRFEDNDNRIEVGNVRFSSDRQLGKADLWLGKSKISLDHVAASALKSDFSFKLSDIEFTSDVSARKSAFDMLYDYKIASMEWGSDKVENLAATVAFTDLDAKSLIEFLDFSRSVDTDSAGAPEQADATVAMLKRLAAAISQHGGAIEIRNVSAQYHGRIVALNGRIALPNLKQSDFDNLQKVYQKLDLRIKLVVPMPIIEDVAHVFARSIMEAQARQNGAQVTDMTVDLVARGMVDKMTEMLVRKQKWAHMEKDSMVTVFEIRNGRLHLDHHLVTPQSYPFMAMAQGK